jgi:hypothetical protein
MTFAYEPDEWVAIGVAAAAMRTSIRTAQRDALNGLFGEVRYTPGGHRRVKWSEVQKQAQRRYRDHRNAADKLKRAIAGTAVQVKR